VTNREQPAATQNVEAMSDGDSHAQEEVVRAYISAFGTQDPAECVRFFNDHAMVRFLQRAEGLAAIEKWHRRVFDNGVRIVNVGAMDVVGDTVTVALAITSKQFKFGFKLRGHVVLRLRQGKIEEMSFK
jgi:SnoaL-like domain